MDATSLVDTDSGWLVLVVVLDNLVCRPGWANTAEQGVRPVGLLFWNAEAHLVQKVTWPEPVALFFLIPLMRAEKKKRKKENKMRIRKNETCFMSINF